MNNAPATRSFSLQRVWSRAFTLMLLALHGRKSSSADTPATPRPFTARTFTAAEMEAAQVVDCSIGSPSAFHSGKPSSSRAARRPSSVSICTASSA